jgi:hypothetical protein
MFYIGLGERQENLRGEPIAFSLNLMQREFPGIIKLRGAFFLFFK